MYIDQIGMIQNFLGKLLAWSQTSNKKLIIGGDFSLAIDTYLDRSSNQRLAQFNASNFLNSYIKNTNLVDLWRILNSTGREYLFHSWAHNVYSRKDFFLQDSKLLSGVENVKYHNIIISDHCLISVSLRLLEVSKNFRSWRLDPQLLTRK